MRNILKGFLEPKAEAYVLPSADEIRFEGEEFAPQGEEEPVSAASLDVTVESEEEPAPEPEKVEEPKKELCKERNSLYKKQSDLKGRKWKLERLLER